MMRLKPNIHLWLYSGYDYKLKQVLFIYVLTKIYRLSQLSNKGIQQNAVCQSRC